MDFIFGTYNFQNGGIDGCDTQRFSRQMGRLARHGATAWAFQECSEWDTNGCLETAEELLEMRGYMAKSNKNPRGNLAVFVSTDDHIRILRTRHEGLMHEERVLYWHAVAVVHIDVMGFGMVRLGSAHLAPSSPEKRAEEAEYIGLIAEKKIPLIMGMDANGYALNEPRRDVKGIHDGKVRRKSDVRAAAYLAEYMTDCGEYLGIHTPTVGHGDGLEYIADRNYTTLPESTIIDHKVVTDEDEDSDHRKVLTTFRLEAP